jgi:HK97 family phage major capsid protein
MDVHEDGTLGDDVQLIKPATTIKAIEGQPGRVGGYLVVWGNSAQKDLQGEYFTPETDLGLDWYEQRPALYHHGLDEQLQSNVVGVIDTLKMDATGLWAEAQLDVRKRYVQAVMQLVDKGVLGWSSGSLSHLVDVAQDGQIKRWPIVEGSLTPTPAEPRHTDIHAIKSAYDELGLDLARLQLPDSEEGNAASEEPPAKEQAAKTAAAVDTDQSTTRTFKMDMQTIVQQVLAGLLAARPEWQVTPEEQAALIQQILASLSAPAEQPVQEGMMSVAMEQAAGKTITALTAHFNAKAQKAAAHQTMLQTAVKGAIATVPAQPQPQFTGGQNGQQQSNRQFVNQLTVKTKYGELNAEDMSYLYGLRKKYNAARGLGATAFEDAEEQQRFLREIADKAGKSYESGQVKFGDEKETNSAIKSINAIKSDELDYSTQASYGDEWVPDLWASQIWNKFRLDAVIAPLFRVIEMPSDPFELPIESTDPTVYFVPETKNEADLTVATSGNPTPDSKIGSGKVQLASKKLSLRVGFSEEMVEDSIIPIISMYREQAQKTLILSIDQAVLNGDTAAANNVNLDGGTPATTAVYKAFDGIRKLALVTASPVNAVDMGGLAPTIAKIRQARFTMPAARASLPGKIAYITHGELYAKLLSLSEVITADKFGPNATIVTGQLGNLDGSKLLLTDQLSLTASNGKISNTGGNNTFGELVGVHTDSFVVGYRRKVNVNVDRIPATDSYQLSANVRIAFVSIDSEGAFVLYDILV